MSKIYSHWRQNEEIQPDGNGHGGCHALISTDLQFLPTSLHLSVCESII